MLALIPLLAALPGVWAGMYNPPVINLDAKTFKQALSVEHAAMVAFVAPWCGHCKSLGPEFTNAAASLSPLIPFYAIDCDDAGNKRLCAEYKVEGFPTIKAFPRALKGAARDYQGERKAGALIEYAKSLVPDRVKKLRVDDGADAALSRFLGEKSNLPHALLIHPSTPSIPFMWKVLGQRLSSKLHVGYIKDTASHDTLTALGIYDPADTSRDATRAVYWAAGASQAEIVEYEGGFKFNALLEWLQALLDGKTPPPAQKEPQEKRTETPPANDEAKAARQAELDRKAKLRAKMEEADRRDQARRERAAAKAQAASKVEDAARPVAEESVEDERLRGSSAAEGIVSEAQPEEASVDGAGAEVRETMAHEEL